MLARLCAFVLWALVAATAVFWGLRLLVRAPSAPAAAVAVADATSTRVDLTRLLGEAPVAVAAPAAQLEVSSRFRLLGIMAPKPSAIGPAHGVALIAVDGKLPKAFQVGAAVDGEMLLQSVSMRSASLGPARGGPGMTLELPPLPSAATGTLPGLGPAQGPVSGVPGLTPRFATQPQQQQQQQQQQPLMPQATASPSFAVPQIPNPAAPLVPQPPPSREPGAATQ
jgi:general secretion pathway protein C